MSVKCVYCNAPASWRHHPTGRDRSNGYYLDPTFTLPTCRDHHALFHDDWRTLGVQDLAEKPQPGRGLAFVERVELCLRRGAALAGRLATAHPQHAWILQLAEALKRCANELARDIAARDRRDPGWRSDLGFYPGDG